MAYRQGNVTPAQLDAESRDILTANRLDAIAAETEARRQRDALRTAIHVLRRNYDEDYDHGLQSSHGQRQPGHAQAWPGQPAAERVGRQA